ncbi:MAG: hypothetical protein ACI9FR_000452 [Cryomorphaceae bacterium]|jgi:hypothetical protein
MGEYQYVWSWLALLDPLAICKAACANYYFETSGSLMPTKPPCDEMPYSAMLQKLLNNNEIPTFLKNSVERYIAGHLFDLVRRNFLSGNASVAQRLLRDSRAKADVARNVVCKIRIIQLKFKQLLRLDDSLAT